MPSDEPLPDKCGARLRGSNKGKFCTRPKMKNGRCAAHGGKSLRGAASGRFKTGKYSKYFKHTRMGEMYEESEGDGDLLSLRSSVAVIDAAVKRSAERVADLDTPEFRKRALDHYRDAMAARDDGDMAQMAHNLNELGKLLRRGALEDSALRTLVDSATRASKVIADGWKIKLAQSNAINYSDLATLMSGFLAIVCDNTDRKTAQKITEGVSRMMGSAIAPGLLTQENHVVEHHKPRDAEQAD